MEVHLSATADHASIERGRGVDGGTTGGVAIQATCDVEGDHGTEDARPAGATVERAHTP